MTVLLTADLHLSEQPRDAYRFRFVEEFLPQLLKEERAELLLILGDLTEQKQGFGAELVNRIAKAFHDLARICPVVFLQGNHDYYSGPASPFFGFLERLGEGRIAWVGRPTPLAQVKNVPEAVSRRLQGLLLPHSANPERDWADLDFTPYDWIFAHQSFAGALSESGHQLGGVSLSWFPKGSRIVAGDIHRPQENGNLICVGSPYKVDFGETFEPRVLLLGKQGLESIPVPGPQKQLIELGSIADLVKAGRKLNKGDIVKLRIPIANYADWPAALEEITDWAEKAGVILHQAQPIIQNAVSAKALDKKAVQTDEQLLTTYARKRQLADGYLNTGLKLL